MKYIYILFALLFCNSVYADEFKYKVSEIPKELLVDANAVIRVYNKEFTVYSRSEGKERVKYAITILNKKARGLSKIREYYNNNSSLKIIGAKIFNKDGKIIKKIKKKDIGDFASNPGFMLLGDSRTKVYNYSSDKYPYTIEYEFEKKYSSLVSYTRWIPISSYNTSLEKASLNIVVPKTLKARYKCNNCPSDVVITNNDETINYSWNISDFKCIKYEFLSPNYIKVFPNVIVAPTLFEYEKYLGDMSTWTSYGKWTYSLLEGRDVLNDEIKNEVTNLVSGIQDKREIVKKVYQYVQNKTRYVCVSLGIGGFQPFPANEVDKNGYGDCKALSNYTKALLKEVGIESFYAEVGAGSSKRIEYKDFSSADQTNHIILCVPMHRDTIWLECTSQDSPFNYLGKFTSDRCALLVSKDGGKLVKTHQYNINDNIKESVSKMVLSKDGNLRCSIKSKYHSLYFDDISYYFNVSEKEKKEHLLKSLPVSDYSIENYDFKMLNDGKYTCGERKLDLLFSSYVSATDKRVFLPLNLVNKCYYKFRRNKSRKYKIVEDECYTVRDTIILNIPDCYTVESAPRSKDIKSKYGNYKTEITIDWPNIEYIRTLSINKGEYPPEEFKDFYNFHKKVRKAEKAKLVLLKND